jgi:hypothetical protein
VLRDLTPLVLTPLVLAVPVLTLLVRALPGLARPRLGLLNLALLNLASRGLRLVLALSGPGSTSRSERSRGMVRPTGGPGWLVPTHAGPSTPGGWR